MVAEEVTEEVVEEVTATSAELTVADLARTVISTIQGQSRQIGENWPSQSTLILRETCN